MVALGLILLVAVVVLGIVLLSQPSPPSRAVSYQARAVIHDIERQTIQAMLAAELAAQRADIIEGTTVEERRP